MLFTLVLVAGCHEHNHASDLVAESPSPDDFSEEFIERWRNYEQETQPPEELSLQAACVPQVLAASSDDGLVRGTVFLVHGFTACNQQYFDWSLQLAKAGFHTVLVVLPGHGLEADAETLELEAQLLPASSQAYADLALELIAMAEDAPGPQKVVVGLSVGGAVAAHAALKGGEVFDKALLLAPFLAIPQTFTSLDEPPPIPFSEADEQEILERLLSFEGNEEDLALLWQELAEFFAPYAIGTGQALLEVLKLTQLLAEFDFGWGEACEFERASGRAGICNFKLKHMFAADDFGRETLRAYQQAESIGPLIQLVAIENDDGADARAIEQLCSYIENLAPQQSSTCLYPFGEVPHSFLSKFDNVNLAPAGSANPTEDALVHMQQNWLDRFYLEALQFLISDSPDFFAQQNAYCERY